MVSLKANSMLASAPRTAVAVRLPLGEHLIGSILTYHGATLCSAILIAAVVPAHQAVGGPGCIRLTLTVQSNPPLIPRGRAFAPGETNPSPLRLVGLLSLSASCEPGSVVFGGAGAASVTAKDSFP